MPALTSPVTYQPTTADLHPVRHCSYCARPLSLVFADLGTAPPCQRQIAPADADLPEPTYPLRALVCEGCWLVQVPAVLSSQELFDEDYPYFSSYSSTWVEHAGRFVDAVSRRLNLGTGDFVVEVASNDGYLLQHFVDRGVRVLGVEPTKGTAVAAEAKGVPTLVDFFSLAVAEAIRREHGAARLIVANNVLAHVPDVRDLVTGMRALLAPGGTITLEFPHLLELIRGNQFDTIYHEHFSYFSFGVVARILRDQGLRALDVEILETHGGSLRVYACHAGDLRPDSPAVADLLAREEAAGLARPEAYTAFAEGVARTKRQLLTFLIEAKESGCRVVGYGAAGKGATLLNYCGIRSDLVDYVVDRNPHKQGHLMPGSRLAILPPEQVLLDRPDYLLVLPWNLAGEVMDQMSTIRDWGGRFVVPIPEVTVL